MAWHTSKKEEEAEAEEKVSDEVSTFIPKNDNKRINRMHNQANQPTNTNKPLTDQATRRQPLTPQYSSKEEWQ